MGQAIRTFVARSHLAGLRTKEAAHIEIEHLSLALAWTAWAFFCRSRGEMGIRALCDAATESRARWQRLLSPRHPSRSEILIALTVMVDEQSCAALLQRTVFLPTGPDSYRFLHRSWQEYLLARYLALCLEHANLDDLARAKFYSGIYRMAAELFPYPLVDGQLITDVLAAWEERRDSYLISNIIGFLSWTRTPMEAPAIRRLLDAVPRLDALARIILIGGLGYRILVNDPRDPSLGDLRSIFFPKLREFSEPGATPFDDPVASSLAWCYRKAFASSFGTQAPTAPWPGLEFEDRATLRALRTICAFRGGRPVLDERSRSLQLALLIPLLDTVNHPRFVIRALHYLYYLIAARAHAVHTIEVSQELPHLLAEGSPFEKIVLNFEAVPELLELYRSCRDANHRLDSGVF
jgi:hypothetical protein